MNETTEMSQGHGCGAFQEKKTDAWRPEEAHSVDVLARTVYGEARGESVRGMEAVAAVVVNRVNMAPQVGYWWGRGVREVCLKPWQFSCWNRDDPNRAVILAAGLDDPVFAICRRIARRALAGVLEDPTDGATHYHARGRLPSWARDRIPCAEIGNHLFYSDVDL